MQRALLLSLTLMMAAIVPATAGEPHAIVSVQATEPSLNAVGPAWLHSFIEDSVAIGALPAIPVSWNVSFELFGPWYSGNTTDDGEHEEVNGDICEVVYVYLNKPRLQVYPVLGIVALDPEDCIIMYAHDDLWTVRAVLGAEV